MTYFINKVFCGDWIEIAKSMPDCCVHTIITSPPYWGQRNYGVEGQLGLEKTPEEHIEKLVAGFRELRRILRDDGTLWLNYGDKYCQNGKWGGQSGNKNNTSAAGGYPRENRKSSIENLQSGDLIGLAWRLALALQADGWILRDDIIWAKAVSFCPTYSGSTMPESVNGWRWEQHRVEQCPACKSLQSFKKRKCHVCGFKKDSKRDRIAGKEAGVTGMRNHSGYEYEQEVEFVDCPGCAKCEPNGGLILRKGSWRPTRAHEFLFEFSKTGCYFCDAEAVKEDVSESSLKRIGQANFANQTGGDKDYGTAGINRNRSARKALEGFAENPNGRNLRDVWTINPQPWSRAHYATFPEDLVEPIIKVATSQKGVCPKCGSPWARIIDSKELSRRKPEGGQQAKDARNHAVQIGGNNVGTNSLRDGFRETSIATIGWRATCGCGCEETVPAVVYDPFMGSGTVGAVAAHLGRNYGGSELNAEYLEQQAQLRIKAAVHGISIQEAEYQQALFE